MVSFDMCPFSCRPWRRRPAPAGPRSDRRRSAPKAECSFSFRSSRGLTVALPRLTQGPNTSSSVSRCLKLAFGSRFCENGRPDRIRRRSLRVSEPSSPRAKTNPGNFFEDFRLGQQIRHATPRTVTRRRRGALSTACSGRALPCSRPIRSRKRSAIRARRSTICWCSTWCSARPCPTSRSMPSPISAMPIAAFSKPSIRATRSTRCRK